MAKFIEEEVIRLEAIVKKPDNEWAPLLKEMSKDTNRSYGSLWQKAYAMKQRGNKPHKRKTAGTGPGRKKKGTSKKAVGQASTKKARTKSALSEAPVKRSYGSRKSHRSPLANRYMTVSPNEVRFPIQGIRIEGGELIVTFK